MLKGIYVLNFEHFDLVYNPEVRARIEQHVEIYAPLHNIAMIEENPAVLQQADVIFSSWGCPEFNAEILAAAPNLKVIFYAAGSVRGIVTEAFWQRGVQITSAYKANAEPVAEFTLAQILLSLKLYWRNLAAYQQKRASIRLQVPGAYGTTIGLVSLGAVGARVAQRLKPFDMRVLAYDPYMPQKDAEELGVELCSLEDVFARSQVVSLHTPWIPETEGMIQAVHFELMPQDATFINTARGAVVREDEMIAVLRRRPDLTALLDVTHPEPPVPDSPFYTMPNVFLTPHIAGSMDRELGRMGQYMADELLRYLNGQPMQYQINQEKFKIMA